MLFIETGLHTYSLQYLTFSLCRKKPWISVKSYWPRLCLHYYSCWMLILDKKCVFALLWSTFNQTLMDELQTVWRVCFLYRHCVCTEEVQRTSVPAPCRWGCWVHLSGDQGHSGTPELCPQGRNWCCSQSDWMKHAAPWRVSCNLKKRGNIEKRNIHKTISN